MPVIHHKLICVHGIKEKSFVFLQKHAKFYQYHLLKTLHLSRLITLAPSLKIN